MTFLVYLALVLALFVALAMMKARLVVWAGAFAVAVLVWQMGVFTGEGNFPPTSILGILAWLPAVALAVLAIPALRRQLVIATGLCHCSEGAAAGFGDGTAGTGGGKPSGLTRSCFRANRIGTGCLIFRVSS